MEVDGSFALWSVKLGSLNLYVLSWVVIGRNYAFTKIILLIIKIVFAIDLFFWNTLLNSWNSSFGLL